MKTSFVLKTVMLSAGCTARSRSATCAALDNTVTPAAAREESWRVQLLFKGRAQHSSAPGLLCLLCCEFNNQAGIESIEWRRVTGLSEHFATTRMELTAASYTEFSGMPTFVLERAAYRARACIRCHA